MFLLDFLCVNICFAHVFVWYPSMPCDPTIREGFFKDGRTDWTEFGDRRNAMSVRAVNKEVHDHSGLVWSRSQVQKNTNLQNYCKNIKKQCKLDVKRTKNCKNIFVKVCFYIFQ